MDGDRFCRRCGRPLAGAFPAASASPAANQPPSDAAPSHAALPNGVPSDSAPPGVACGPTLHNSTPPGAAPYGAALPNAAPREPAPSDLARFAGIASEGSAGDQGLSAGPPAPPPSAPADGWPFASPFDLPAPPPRRHDLRSGSTLALLFIALVLLLAGTNPSPAAYVAWAARRIFPEARLAPIRDAAYLAVERATVAESYGVCTIFQTTFTTGTMTVIGIVGQFVTIGNGPPQAPLPGRQPRPQQRSSGGVQI